MGLEPTCPLNLIRLTSYLATLVPSQSLDLLDILPHIKFLKWRLWQDSNLHIPPPCAVGLYLLGYTRRNVFKMAEGRGFEPLEAIKTPAVFKTAAFNHSAIPLWSV